MSGLVVGWECQEDACAQILSDVASSPFDQIAHWRDPSQRLWMGVAGRREAVGQSPSIAQSDGCTAIVDSVDLGNHPKDSPNAAQSIIAAYRRWGMGCVQRIEGEFAFALWDGLDNQLVIACDPLGMRSLAYFWDGRTFLAASRAIGILRHPGISSDLDRRYCARVLCGVLQQPPGATVFSAIRRMRPGYAIRVRPGTIREERASELVARADASLAESTEEHAELFNSILDHETAKIILNGDPVCLLLSGGLDSSMVAASAVRANPKIHALTIAIDQFPALDDRAFIADLVAQYREIRLQSVRCDDAWAFAEPWNALPLPDVPVASNPALRPALLRLVSRAGELGFRTMLDGEGGDEFFQVLVRFGDLLHEQKWGTALRYLLRTRGARSVFWREFAVARLPPSLRRLWLARERGRLRLVPPWANESFAGGVELNEMYDELAAPESWMPYGQRVVKMLEVSVEFRRAERLLRSSYGVEPASPLLSRPIVEYALALSSDVRIHSRHGKVFLRRVARSRVPESIRWRPKDVSLYAVLEERGLRAFRPRADALREIPSDATVREFVDVDCLASALMEVRPTAGEDTLRSRQIAAALAFWDWERGLRELVAQTAAKGGTGRHISVCSEPA